MAKRNFWVSKYQRNIDTVEITIKDGNGAKIETWVIGVRDEKRVTKVMRILKEKYGFAPTIPKDLSVNTLRKEKDLSWLKEDTKPF